MKWGQMKSNWKDTGPSKSWTVFGHKGQWIEPLLTSLLICGRIFLPLFHTTSRPWLDKSFLNTLYSLRFEMESLEGCSNFRSPHSFSNYYRRNPTELESILVSKYGVIYNCPSKFLIVESIRQRYRSEFQWQTEVLTPLYILHSYLLMFIIVFL